MKTSIEQQLIQQDLYGVRLIIMPMDTENIVSISGSFSGPGYGHARNRLIPDIVLNMIPVQTMSRPRREISRLLEQRGVRLSLDLDHDRLNFTARCLRDDASIVIQLLAEMIRNPLFTPEELETQKRKIAASIRREMSNTAARGRNHLTRLIYPPGHANYVLPGEERLRLLERIRVRDLEIFHEQHYGKNQFFLVLAGDVNPTVIDHAVRAGMGGWKRTRPLRDYEKRSRLRTDATNVKVGVRDKTKIDVFFGHALPLTRRSDDYDAAYLANYILGGNFSARLATILREKHGLTYGVASGLTGLEGDLEGAWMIQMMVNPHSLIRAIGLAREELRKFTEEGISSEELNIKKNTVIGEFRVDMATSMNMAQTIHGLLVKGLELGLLDAYPERIDALSLGQVNEAIRRYYHENKLFMVVSGNPMDIM